MFCENYIDWKSATPVVRSNIVVLLMFVLWFGLVDRAIGQEAIEVVQVPADAFEAPSTGQYFEVDNDHSSLLFAVSHAGLSYTYGRFEKCSGQIHLTENLDSSYFRFEIDVASINTNNRLRDDHLRGPEFFETKKFPKIEFRSTAVKHDGASEKFVVTGTMSMHGVEREVEMPVTMVGVGKGPMGKTRGGFATKFTIQRSDFGIGSMHKVIGDQIAITFSFEAIQKEAAVKDFNRFTEKK